MAKKVKSRYWSFIMYLDSRPDDWMQQLIQTHLPIAISPEHNRDVDPVTGELLKPHHHVLLCFDGPTTLDNVNRISQDMMNATICQQVMSVKGLYDYFVHPADTCKMPYLDSDRINLNGFAIENYTQMTSKEEVILVKQIMQQIKINQFMEYAELVDAMQLDDIQAYDYIIHHTVFFNTYLTSLRNKIKDQKKKEIEKQLALKKEY